MLANATVISTSTRNFPNRLGDGADVYLGSAELATVGGILGHLPTRKSTSSTQNLSIRCPKKYLAT